MRRREFIGGIAGGAAAGALGCPGWIRRALAQEATPDDALAVLSEAYRRAQQRGQPLLVIVIPTDVERIWDRQCAFGELLNHGGDAVMRDLALVELVCADAATLRTLFPQMSGEPMMVLVEPESVPPTVVPLDPTMDALPQMWRIDLDLTREERLEAEERVIDRRIATLAGVIHQALAADASALAHRAAIARSHVPAVDLARVDGAIAAWTVNPTIAALAPAIVAEAATRTPALARSLVELGTQRWVRGVVPGSQWANESGCGLDIEGGRPSAIACGMGHTPERSSRLLYWHTRWS